MGCIARLGCLVVLLVCGTVAYFTRDRWMPEQFRSKVVATSTSTSWQPLDASGVERTRTALAKLSEKTGPAFQTISITDLASFAVSEFTKQLPPSTDSVATRTSGDTVFVRANVRIADLGARSALGPFASMLGDRETIQVAGTMRVVEPGRAELVVQDVKIRNLSLPSGMIPEVIRRVTRGGGAASARNAIAVPIPKSLGDIRVARGKATLYKSGQ